MRFVAVCGSVRTLPRCRRRCRRSQRGGVATLPHARQVARLEKVSCGKNIRLSPIFEARFTAVCGSVRTLPRCRRGCRCSQRGGVATLPHARQAARLEKVFCAKNTRLSPIFWAWFPAVCGSVRTLPRSRRGRRSSQRGGVATLPHARQAARLEKVFCGKI
jgi:hypothetical protein